MAKSAASEEEREELIAYLDGELDAVKAKQFEARLSREPNLRAELEVLRRTWNLLEYLPRPEPSAAFTSKTLGRISALRPAAKVLPDSAEPEQPLQPKWSARQPLPRLVGWAWAAGVLGALIGGYAVGYALSRPPWIVAPGVESPEVQQVLHDDLHLIDNLRQFDSIEDLAFLRELADPDLFGDEL